MCTLCKECIVTVEEGLLLSLELAGFLHKARLALVDVIEPRGAENAHDYKGDAYHRHSKGKRCIGASLLHGLILSKLIYPK